ncbi:MAG: hypothetical protein IJ857_00480, partial [Lachnospiraceae bacterium]|nr:hypothetical protein [Lachnospiraceae bacterium]
FKFEDTKVFAALNALFPRTPRRNDYNSLDEYKKAVAAYDEAIIKYNNYKTSNEFETLVKGAFKEAVEAYKAEYNSLVSKYGSNLDYMKKWIEEEWAVTGVGAATNVIFPGPETEQFSSLIL